MRRLALLGSLLLFACRAPEAQSQKLNDGSWSFTCELPMEDCIRQVEKTCRSQRYRILEGVSEVRVHDVPPLESTYYTSRLRLMCNEEGAALLSTPAARASVAPDAARPELAAACTKGETRECVGAGACRGGQACLPDGTGFGACDCGSAEPPAAVPVPALSPADLSAPTAP